MRGPRLVMDEVLCHFAELEDPGSEGNRKRPPTSAIVIAFMAFVAHASVPTGIALWAETHSDFLQGVISLPNGLHFLRL